MNKFKKGDRIRCIDAGNHTLIRNGGKYTVEGPGFDLTNSDDKLIQLEGIKDYLGFFEYRFELVKSEFNISTATDQELADEFRRVNDERAALLNALKERGFEVKVDGVIRIKIRNGNEYAISKTVAETVSL